MRFVTRKIFWHFHLLENGKGREVTWNSFPSTFGQEHFSNLFNKSLFFSEWNIYKYFPSSLKSAMVFFSLDISIMQIMIGVHGWPGPSMIKNCFLLRMHFVFLFFLIPSNHCMCDKCIQFQSFPLKSGPLRTAKLISSWRHFIQQRKL